MNESDEETIPYSSSEGTTLWHELNTSFGEVSLSPIKLHGVASHSKVAWGKHKLRKFHDKLKELETIAQKPNCKSYWCYAYNH